MTGQRPVTMGSMHPPVPLDAVVFGGGVCGLWILDELRRAGYAACLVETCALGAGQTVASQGIIHGGLKYTLDGVLNPSAEAIREMPQVWRECLRGQRQPDLRQTRVLTEYCHLWRTGGLGSRLGMVGAKLALRVRPVQLAKGDWPGVLRETAGEVLRLDEQVIDPASLLSDLARQNQSALLPVSSESPAFELDDAGAIQSITVANVATGVRLTLQPRVVVLSAGQGNAALRQACGLEESIMQRRPLHMLMVRGPLPELYGHCTDGARTRVTITTNRDSAGRTIWVIGGHVAEEGVRYSAAELIAHGQRELHETVGELPFAQSEFATYQVVRAEPATAENRRPSDAFAKREANIVTVWPTKLALAPRAAERVLELIPPPQSRAAPIDMRELGCPLPAVAHPPWEEAAWSPAH